MNRGAVLLAMAIAALSTLGRAAESHPDGSTPLQWAVFNGDIAETKRLLAQGADVKASNAYGVNALLLAAEASNTELIRLLLKAGADPRSANADDETVLHLVARSGNLAAAKLLLKAGAKVDEREHFGEQTPLMWAVARRHAPMVELLLSKHAEVNARSAVRDYQRVATAESRAKFLDRGGFTPLQYAARENCGECVEVLLKHKADVNLPDPAGVGPLAIALMNANWDIAKRLIEAGADVNQWDLYGQAPLHVAIENLRAPDNGNPLDINSPNQATGSDVVKLLVARGANPNQQLFYRSKGRAFEEGGTGRGTTPFLMACAVGDIEIVKLLLAHGANPQLATADGQGPIIMAITRNIGAPRGARGRAGGPDVVREERNNSSVELVKLLAAAGADVKLVAQPHFLQRTRGGSALHYATRLGDKQALDALVALGLDVNIKDADGLTALDYAQARGFVPFLAQASKPRKDLVDQLHKLGATAELAKTPDWVPQGPPIGVTVYDAVLWPVDPVGY